MNWYIYHCIDKCITEALMAISCNFARICKRLVLDFICVPVFIIESLVLFVYLIRWLQQLFYSTRVLFPCTFVSYVVLAELLS